MSTAVSAAPPQRIDYATRLSGRAKSFILAGVMLGLFLAALDQTIVATALPAIIAALQGLHLLSWIGTGYLLASTATVPIYGKLSDLYGRRSIVLFGIVVFLLGSALCGLAQTMVQLILFRVLQGLGAAALTSSAFAIPADLFAPADRPRIQGLFGVVWALASVIGPYLGGLLTDNLGWRWVFYVNVPVGALALGFVLFRMPALRSGLRAPIDWAGTALLIAAVVPLLLGLSLDRSLYPWGSPLVSGLFVTAALAGAAFLWAERRAPSPILPLKLFGNRTFALVGASSLLMGAAFFGAIFFLSIFMVNVVGVNATAAGTTLIPLTFGVVAGAAVASAIVQRTGRYKRIILLGFVVAAVGFVLLALMDEMVTRAGVTWRMIIVGVGLGPTMPLLTLVVQNAVPFEQVGAATASRQFFMQVGATVGVAIFGAVLAGTLAGQVQATAGPVLDDLPPQVRRRFEVTSASGAGPGGTSGQTDIQAAIAGAIKAEFARFRELATAAIRNADPRAREVLLSHPRTPVALRDLIMEGGSLPRALAILDQAEREALEQGQTLAQRLRVAIRHAFAVSITRIYAYAIPLVVLSLLLMLALPEIPLRTSNRPVTPEGSPVPAVGATAGSRVP